MTSPLDMTWHPWYSMSTNETEQTVDNNSGINYQRNFSELVWYQEYIYQDGALIGEIFTNITDGGYNLRKLTDIGPAEIMQDIAQFETVSDAKDFVNQAGGL
jgi:hypothetical protein